MNLITDPATREYNEMWPGGRTNHYWFDLNRDWLLLVHPESQARVANFHQWKPNVLTDHHEMGTQSTFFSSLEYLLVPIHLRPQKTRC
ncbi:MAG: hypothetical protein IPH94_17975 [Saprospiraceae bacterium]|nr:hypothetical protein [Saprospiraceae bacterium]